jgi:small nuclear ribonucleoprotein (snRNP)-like protein
MGSLNKFSGLLGYKMRITISDGRLIEGELQCMDSDMNFVLGAATEYHGVTDRKPNAKCLLDNCIALILFYIAATLTLIGQEYISRNLGMAMVPGKYVIKVFAINDVV